MHRDGFESARIESAVPSMVVSTARDFFNQLICFGVIRERVFLWGLYKIEGCGSEDGIHFQFFSSIEFFPSPECEGFHTSQTWLLMCYLNLPNLVIGSKMTSACRCLIQHSESDDSHDTALPLNRELTVDIAATSSFKTPDHRASLIEAYSGGMTRMQEDDQ